MIVSHRKKFIFIHVPKTGGTSLTHVLAKYSNPLSVSTRWKERSLRYFGAKLSGKINLFDNHIKSCDAINEVGADKFEKYFKFGFMRNPFDFIVSSYFYQKSDKSNINYNLVNSFKNFSEFIHNTPHSASYQKDFITINNEIALDFVGNFNDMNNSLFELERHLNISFKKIPFKNKSHHSHFSKYYDNELRNHVFKLYQDDVELYNELFKIKSEDF